MANKDVDKIKEELSRELTDSQNDRDVIEFSNNVNNFLNVLIDRTLTDSELQTSLEQKLLSRLEDINSDTIMTDGTMVELLKVVTRNKTDNANVISNIIKGMADALLIKKGFEKDSPVSGDLTKKDIDDVRSAMTDIKELREFMEKVIKTEK